MNKTPESIKASINRSMNYDQQELALVSQVVLLAYSRHDQLKGDVELLIGQLNEDIPDIGLADSLIKMVRECSYIHNPWVESFKSVLLRPEWNLSDIGVDNLLMLTGYMSAKSKVIRIINKAMAHHEEERRTALVKAAEPESGELSIITEEVSEPAVEPVLTAEASALVDAVMEDESYSLRDRDYWLHTYGDDVKAIAMLAGKAPVICARALAILAMAYEEKFDDDLIVMLTVRVTQ